MRWLPLVFLIACGSSGSTSLEGPAPCGPATCASGQLCRHRTPGIDAGGPASPPTCVTVASGCDAVDCTGTACPDCIVELCSIPDEFVYLVGRDLYCSAP